MMDSSNNIRTVEGSKEQWKLGNSTLWRDTIKLGNQWAKSPSAKAAIDEVKTFLTNIADDYTRSTNAERQRLPWVARSITAIPHWIATKYRQRRMRKEINKTITLLQKHVLPLGLTQTIQEQVFPEVKSSYSELLAAEQESQKNLPYEKKLPNWDLHVKVLAEARGQYSRWSESSEAMRDLVTNALCVLSKSPRVPASTELGPRLSKRLACLVSGSPSLDKILAPNNRKVILSIIRKTEQLVQELQDEFSQREQVRSELERAITSVVHTPTWKQTLQNEEYDLEPFFRNQAFITDIRNEMRSLQDPPDDDLIEKLLPLPAHDQEIT